MKNKSFYLVSVIAMLSIYGCSNDSSGSSTPAEPECSLDAECSSGVCLTDGQCAQVVTEGEHCDDAHLCTDGLLCLSGICKTEDPEPPKEECSQDSDCDGEQVCESGKCKEKTTHEPECTSDEECSEGQVCKDGSCEDKQVEPQPPVTSETCDTDEDCAGNEINTICMSNGNCGHYVDLGEYCDEYETYCQDGYLCMGKCIQELDEGEACIEGDEVQTCRIGLGCYDGYCHAVQEDVAIGNACNDEYLLCAKDLTCVDGKCIDYQKVNENCDEANYLICDSGMFCKDAICTPIGNPCSEMSDCDSGDSYCCLDESCGAKGHCIPYDKIVTHNEMCRIKPKPGIFEAQIQCRWQPGAEQYPNSSKVEMPPLVGHFGNKEKLNTVVAFFSYNLRTGAANYNELAGVIRFIDPSTCRTLEDLRYDIIGHSRNMPAAADLDGDPDGLMEFITFNSSGHTIAFKWNDKTQKHELLWENDLAGKDTTTTYKNEERTYHNPKNYYIQVFDVNDDGKPEVIVGDSVINGQDGKTIYAGRNLSGYNGAIGYLDDSSVMLTIHTDVFKWNKDENNWKSIATLPYNSTFKAYADFGKPGKTAEDFNFEELDGIPEIVSSSGGVIRLYSLIAKGDGNYDVQTIMTLNLLPAQEKNSEGKEIAGKGGPITIGDYDNDGLPEIGLASSGYYGVYDPRCKEYKENECADKNVLWERWSQDASSGVTGSSLFDFDGDGKAEVVYADECFTRIYDGKTGKVLFSSKRSSGTSYEAPVVADIDDDGSSEILMGSDSNQSCYGDSSKYEDDTKNRYNPTSASSTPLDCVDPIHEGIRCKSDEDCPFGKEGSCNTEIELCMCTSDDDCNTQYVKNKDGESVLVAQYVCAPPIHPEVGMMINSDNSDTRKMVKPRGARPDGYDETSGYKVCRATRKTVDIGVSDLMILKDRLDRWVSSRNIWNQHAYNIININDDGSVPSSAEWLARFTENILVELGGGTKESRRKYNNYRLNEQGKYGAGMAPDITGRFIAGSICGVKKDNEGNPVLDEKGKEIHVISGKLCNRGTKPVAQNLPATFFYYDETKPDHRGDKICTSYTNTIVGVGECGQVGCQISADELEALAGKKVLMISNLDEYGNASTVECNTENNTDWIEIDKCESEIVIIN